MDRQAAITQIRSFFRTTFGRDSPGLNEKGFGGVELGRARVFFEHDEKRRLLICSALIHKFDREPTSEKIQAFRDEERAGTSTGGGHVDYQPENRGLFLSRSYSSPVEDAVFRKDLTDLGEASLQWGDEVFFRVMERLQAAKRPTPP